MGLLSWYRQLKRRQRVVLQAASAVVSFQIILNILYFASLAYWTLKPAEWNMLVISSNTSFLALYYALYAFWHYDVAIDTAKDEIYSRLGVPFIKNLAEFGKKLDKRWSELAPEKRANILNKTDTIIDRVFDKLGEEKPKPKRKKVKAMK